MNQKTIAKTGITTALIAALSILGGQVASANHQNAFKACVGGGPQTQSCEYSVGGLHTVTWSQTADCEVDGSNQIDFSKLGDFYAADSSFPNKGKCGTAYFDVPQGCSALDDELPCGHQKPIYAPPAE